MVSSLAENDLVIKCMLCTQGAVYCSISPHALMPGRVLDFFFFLRHDARNVSLNMVFKTAGVCLEHLK